MGTASAKQQLLELTYAGDIAGDVARWLDDGRSWRWIRHEVETRTRLQISHESLRTWYSPRLPIS